MTIHHIVLLKFKSEVTPEQRDFVKDTIKGLPSQIPAIQGLITGETFSELARGFDEGVIFVFENVAKLHEYRPHKAHLDCHASTDPYIEDKLIIDIESA